MTASVARVLGADVIGLGAQAPWPYGTAEGRGSYFAQIAEATEAEIESAAAFFREAFKEPSPASAWRAELGYPDQVMVRHARCADLIVAYRTAPAMDDPGYARPDTLVMECGLPVLLMPVDEHPFVGEQILLAWKNAREARRAVSTSLPLLKQARSVTVAAICRKNEIEEVESQLRDVSHRLARHGVRATTLAEVERPGGAGDELLRIADTDGCDTIVAGAYGHTRLREWVLGGVTRDLIADRTRYVLLSR